MQIRGINHITIKVSNLKQAVSFYQEVLGGTVVHKGSTDYYLDVGGVWICLIEVKNAKPIEKMSIGVDHFAFSIQEKDFQSAEEILRVNKIPITRGPEWRGGGWTISFTDPDGNHLELYTGSLYERMKEWK